MANDLTTPNNCLNPTFLGGRTDKLRTERPHGSLEKIITKKGAKKQAGKNNAPPTQPTQEAAASLTPSSILGGAKFFPKAKI
jgi:hypothetical protein